MACGGPDTYDFDQHLIHDSSVTPMSVEESMRLNEEFAYEETSEWFEYANHDFGFSFKFPSEAVPSSCFNHGDQFSRLFVFEEENALTLTAEYQCEWETGEFYVTLGRQDELQYTGVDLQFVRVEEAEIESVIQEAWGDCVVTEDERFSSDDLKYFTSDHLNWPEQSCTGGRRLVLYVPDSNTLLFYSYADIEMTGASRLPDTEASGRVGFYELGPTIQ